MTDEQIIEKYHAIRKQIIETDPNKVTKTYLYHWYLTAQSIVFPVNSEQRERLNHIIKPARYLWFTLEGMKNLHIDYVCYEHTYPKLPPVFETECGCIGPQPLGQHYRVMKKHDD